MAEKGRITVKLIAEADVRAFKRMRTSLVKLSDQHWATIRAVKKTSKSIKSFGQIFTKSAKAIGYSAKALKNWESGTNKATKSVKNMKKNAVAAFKAMANSATSAADAIASANYAIGKKGLSLAAKGAGAAFDVAKKGIVVLAAATVAGAYRFASLETAMQQVGVVSNISQEGIAGMIDTLMKETPGAIFSAHQIAEAMAAVGSMGSFSDMIGPDGSLVTVATQIQDITGVASKLAVASGFDDITKSAETLMGAMRTFGYETTESAGVANLLMQAANVSALSMEDMGTALQFVGQRAAAMDLSLEDTIAALATLRNMNIDAGVASRSLSQALAHMTSPTAEGAKWMKRLGLEVTDSEGQFLELPAILENVGKAMENIPYEDEAKRMEILNEMFGQMGSRAILPLIETMDDATGGFAIMREEMNTVDPNLLEENFTRMAGSMENQMIGLKNTIDVLGMTLGQAFLEPLMTMGPEGTSVLQKLTDTLTQPAIMDALKSIGAAFGDLVVELLPLFTDLLLMIAPHLAKFIGFISELLAKEEVKTFLRALITIMDNFLTALMPVLDSLMPVIVELFDALTPFLPLLDFFAQGIVIASKMIKPFIKILVAILNALEPFMPMLLAIGKMIIKMLAIPMQISGAAMGNLIKLLGDIVSLIPGQDKLATSLKNVGSEILNMGDAMKDALKEMDEYDASSFKIGAEGSFGGGAGTTTTVEKGSGLDFASAKSGYNTTIIIEGDVKDEDTLDAIIEGIKLNKPVAM